MCGIAGIWDFENKIEPDLLAAMRDTLSHRGPDDSGIYLDEEHNLGLGHQRLTILDLTPRGHQPMHYDRVWIVHNGEIYNFREIRKTLEAKGHRFESQSDTEVILKSYREWGLEAVDTFRGMFAFCLWDKRENRLFLVRDRAGVKPLYYYFDGRRFIFASELKAILRHPRVERDIDFDALLLYFKFGYIPAPHSIFQKISKLEASSILMLDVERNIRLSRYWNVLEQFGDASPKASAARPQEESFTPDDENEAAEALESILMDSFRLRLVSDVPVGVFLSSGIDSPTVTALLQKETSSPVKTFSIGFEYEALNEAEDAKRIAEHLGTEHHELYCTSQMAIEIIPKVPEIYDEPFGDASAIPTYLVSKFARSHVKVALSADGGDEIFAGYRHHARLGRIHRLISRHHGAARIAAKGLGWEPLKQLLELKIPNIDLRAKKLDDLTQPDISMSRFFFNGVRIWSDAETTTLLDRSAGVFGDQSKQFEASEGRFQDFMSFMRAADYKQFLPDDILTKVDRATMAVSLEGRDPLLDQRIIEFAARLPSQLIVKEGESKYLLRKILHKYVPRELVDRPKHGFAIPLEIWLRKDLKHLVHDYLNEWRIRREGILNWKTVDQEINRFYSGKITSATRLWLLLEFEMWHEKWMQSAH